MLDQGWNGSRLAIRAVHIVDSVFGYLIDIVCSEYTRIAHKVTRTECAKWKGRDAPHHISFIVTDITHTSNRGSFLLSALASPRRSISVDAKPYKTLRPNHRPFSTEFWWRYIVYGHCGGIRWMGLSSQNPANEFPGRDVLGLYTTSGLGNVSNPLAVSSVATASLSIRTA